MEEIKKGFSIAHVNVRSHIRNFNETFITMDHFDVVCIGESWLHEKISDTIISFKGYTSYRQDRGSSQQNNKRGG